MVVTVNQFMVKTIEFLFVAMTSLQLLDQQLSFV
jgi:hypothetical protein